MQNLTTKEIAALKAFRSAFNYPGRPEAEKSDNATVFTAIDITEATDFNLHQAAGLMGALEAKGFCWAWEDAGPGCHHITDKGIDAYYHFHG